MRLCILAATLMLAGCATSRPERIASAGGGAAGYRVKCKQSRSGCLAQIEHACGPRFTIVSEDPHWGGTLADLIPGPVPWWTIEARCGRAPSGAEVALNNDRKRAVAYVKEWEREHRVAKSCEKNTLELRLCGLLADELLISTAVNDFAAHECGIQPDQPMTDECAQRFDAMLAARMFDRYWAADPGRVRARCAEKVYACETYRAFEATIRADHNDVIVEQKKAMLADIEASYRQAKADIDMVERFERLEREAAEERRIQDESSARWEALAIVVNSLDSMGRSMMAAGSGTRIGDGPPIAPSTVPAAATGPKQCSSDFGCSYGQHCAKDSGAMRGVCVTTVDRNSMRTYAPPRGDSFGPGQGSCGFSTDCPIGFRCVKTSGGLYGNCMK